MTTVEMPSPTEPHRKPLWRRLLPPALSVVLVAAVFFWFLPQFTSISAVWVSVRSMSALQIGILVIAALWNLASYQFVMTTTMPGLTFRQAAVSTESTTAVSNTLVGGAAIALGLTYAMNSSWGFSRSRTSVSLLVSGLWNNFAKLGLPVLALVLLAFTGQPSAGRLLAGLLGVAGLVAALVVLGLLLRSRDSAARLGIFFGRVASAVLRPFGRPPAQGWDKAMTKVRDPDRADERQRQHDQAEQPDRHGRAGHHHRAPGVLHRLHHGRLAILTGGQLLPVAEDHQERVVDGHAQADDRHEKLHDHRHLH